MFFQFPPWALGRSNGVLLLGLGRLLSLRMGCLERYDDVDPGFEEWIFPVLAMSSSSSLSSLWILLLLPLSLGCMSSSSSTISPRALDPLFSISMSGSVIFRVEDIGPGVPLRWNSFLHLF